MQPEQKVVGKVPKKSRSKSPRKKLLFLAFVGLILLVLMTVVLVVLTKGKNPNELEPVQKDIQSAEVLNEEGKKDEALARYDELVSSASSNDEKARLLITKANTCFANKDYECALAAYIAADEFQKENYLAAFNKGESARYLKKNDEAKIYYQRTITMSGGDEDAAEIRSLAEGYLEAL